MYTGKIITFFEHKELVSGVCLGQHNDRILVLFGQGRQMHLGTSRIVHVSDDQLDITLPQPQLLQALQSRRERQTKLLDQVCAEELWRAVGGTGQVCGFDMLARQAFKIPTDTDHVVALLRALVHDGIYFKLQGNGFLAHTPAQVEKQQQKVRRAHERQQRITEGTAWLCSVLAGAEKACPNRETYLGYLKSFVVDGKASAFYRDTVEIFAGAGIADQKECFEVLVRLGVWDEDENILPDRYRIPCRWSAAVEEQAGTLAEESLARAVNDPGRTDLTGLQVFSIDEPFTRDVDDALSVEFHDEYTLLGVHIADAAALVPAGSAVDRAAADRAGTIYFPEGKIPMLPPRLSEHMASLQQGAVRPALSFFIKLSGTGAVGDFKIVPSVVRVARKLNYAAVDAAIEQDADFSRLYGLAGALRQQRIAAGGVWCLIPELQIRVDRSKKILLNLRDKETPSQMLVSECMILANYCASLQFKEKGFPAVFRRQAAPAEKPGPSSRPSLFQIYAYRKTFNRMILDVNPGLHGNLGLASYTTVTSPIRKYIDLVNQRQLSSLARHKPPVYSKRDIREILHALQPVMARAALIDQERKRYWLLKLLRQRTGDMLDAILLDATPRGYAILLCDYLFETELKIREKKLLAPGDSVSVIIEHVDPFYGMLTLRLAS